MELIRSTYLDHVNALTPTITDSPEVVFRLSVHLQIVVLPRSTSMLGFGCSVPAQWSSFIKVAGAPRVSRCSWIQRRHDF